MKFTKAVMDDLRLISQAAQTDGSDGAWAEDAPRPEDFRGRIREAAERGRQLLRLRQAAKRPVLVMSLQDQLRQVVEAAGVSMDTVLATLGIRTLEEPETASLPGILRLGQMLKYSVDTSADTLSRALRLGFFPEAYQARPVQWYGKRGRAAAWEDCEAELRRCERKRGREFREQFRRFDRALRAGCKGV